MRSPKISPLSAAQSAWALWLGLLFVIASWIVIGNTHSVTPAYHEAAQHWMIGTDLYLQTGRGFLYLPQAALLYVPFSLLPIALGEICWRVLTIGLFSFGTWKFCRLFEREATSRLFLPATLLAIPLCASGARNGQATLVIAGLMMLATCELARHRWNKATALLCLGFAFKPLTLVLMLLAGGIYRPMSWRLVLGLALVLAVPFLTQRPEFVADQYLDCVEMLRSAAHLGLERPWAHFFGMLLAAGFDVPEALQTLVRVGFAFGTLFVARRAVNQLSPARGAAYVYSLAGCYLMLFNPRTENNTYAMIAPVIGIVCAEAILIRRNYAMASLLAIMALGIVGSYEFGRRLLPATHPVWLAPLMCLAFSVILIVRVILETRRNSTPAPSPGPENAGSPEVTPLRYGPVSG